MRGISLTVEAGEIAALVGSNGAGKSTTLKAIMGLCPHTEGSIHVDSRKLVAKPHIALRHGVVLSPEGRRLFGRLSIVEENLLMGAYSVKNSSLTKDTLARVYAYFPHLLEQRKQMAGSLSAADRLMATPDHRHLCWINHRWRWLEFVAEDHGFITEINKETGITVLLVGTNAQMALGICSLGFVLETGCITAQGTGRELLESPHVREAYLGI